jgi:hypothetical protein
MLKTWWPAGVQRLRILPEAPREKRRPTSAAAASAKSDEELVEPTPIDVRHPSQAAIRQVKTNPNKFAIWLL